MFIFIIDQELWVCELMSCIMGYDHSLSLKEFLNQLNLLYICNRSRVMGTRANEPHYELGPFSRPEG
jgi:hypothetical protein